METMQGLTRRLKATNALQSVVRTMKTLSMVSLRQFETAERAVGVYEHTITLGLQAVLRQNQLSAEAKPARKAHPRESHSRTGVLAIGSDFGLCGRFNERLADFVVEELSGEGLDPAKTPVLVAGERLFARLEARGAEPLDLGAMPGTVAAITPHTDAALVRLDRFQHEHRLDRVLLFHNARPRAGPVETVKAVLLPVDPAWLDGLAKAPWPSRRLPMHTMETDALFAALLRQFLFAAVYRAFARSLAAEHAMRFAAMQSAQSNIRDNLADLNALWRQMRQGAITAELIDAIGRVEALRGRE